MKIQYLWWMLNSKCCVPDEKWSPIYVYIGVFFMYMSFEDDKEIFQN